MIAVIPTAGKIMNILVTGGAGYIGSVVVEELIRIGHRVIVLDNLSTGHRQAVSDGAIFIKGDLNDGYLTEKTIRENKIEAVVHLAASSLVGESVNNPEKYYSNNVAAGVTLLNAMRDARVKKIVFSSTAAVYGEPKTSSVVESDVPQPANPYGETKLRFESALREYDSKHQIRFASLRYFNAAGASERFGEMHDPETHLIPLALQAATGKIPFVQILGTDYPTRDGTCVRDYVHVVDLARAHILALDILESRSEIYNLGCGGMGYSVREVIQAVREVTSLDIPERPGPRREGDPPVLIASSDKIRDDLGWEPEFRDVKVIIASAWAWMLRSVSDH